jgi:hypothetical protein
VLAGAGVGLLVACAIGLGVFRAIRRGGPPAVAPRLRLLVPAYFYPGGKGLRHWERLIDSAGAVRPVAVVNMASGPSKEVDPNFVHVLDRARRAGITLVGYVNTAYARRPLPEAQADVSRWFRLYPQLDGIFFDQQASEAAQVEYYAALYARVRDVRPRGWVVTNPGGLCAEEYLSRPATDVACLAEACESLAAYRAPAWAERHGAGRFCALIAGVAKAEQMEEYVGAMPAKGIGYCYITDGAGANPWDRLPSYWEAEVAAVRRANERRAP